MIGPELEAFMQQWESHTCRSCTDTFGRRRDRQDDLCPKCTQQALDRKVIEAEAASILSTLDQSLPRWCITAGMSQRELTADLLKVPGQLNAVMACDTALAMLGGYIPTRGFGISGGAGQGKTFAIAAIIKRMVITRWKEQVPVHGRKATAMWLRWLRWPEVVSDMRTLSMRDGGLDQATSTMAMLSDIPMLVVDDLGAERMRGGYEDDWATSQLDLLVDRRFNNSLPTCYTTNLQPAALLERYGARFYSRLVGHNPLHTAGRGADLRLTEGGK